MRRRNYIGIFAAGLLLAGLPGQAAAAIRADGAASRATAGQQAATYRRILAQAGKPFYAPATSGRTILITGTWDGGCRRMPGGVWEHSQRTLYGHILDWTWIDYRNRSAVPDCVDGAVDIIHAVQAFSADGVTVPISWASSSGVPGPAPAGLGSVRTAIGLSAVVSTAEETPLTTAVAQALDNQHFCGARGWQPGVAKDILACFTGGLDETPMKATLLIDDTSVPGEIVIYDGMGLPSTTVYPSVMPNDFAHHRDVGNELLG